MKVFIKFISLFLFVLFASDYLTEYGGKIFPSNPLYGAIIIVLLFVIVLFYEDLKNLNKLKIKMREYF